MDQLRFLAALALVPLLLQAQVRTDSSLGRPAQSLAGPQFVIPETLGSLRGANLFHSFSVFSVHAGESATFTTATSGIRNVVSRVTGGDPSLINGPLRLQPVTGTPSLYFINPAGVVFGSGASIDVPGGFHVSTADYLRFPDGVFYATPNSPSTLSSAPPQAFGFLGTNRATVAVIDGARLTASNLQPFSIVAGDVNIENGRVTTRGGEIRIVAVGRSAVEVGPDSRVPAGSGDVRIANGGIFSMVDAGDTGDGGPIHVAASGDIFLVAGGQIASVTRGAGNAGDVNVEANNVTIDGRGTPPISRFSDANRFLTGIISWSTGPYATVEGGPGNVNVVATDSLRILNGGRITSTSNSLGNAATVTVRARSIVLDGALDEDFPSSIDAFTDNDSDGKTGYLVVTATERITLSNGGRLSVVDDGNYFGGLVLDPTPADRTLMTVSAPEIHLVNGGLITTDSIAVASDIHIAFGSRLSLADSSITASSVYGGDSGSIVISGPGVLSLRNSRITTSIPTFEGSGGDIRITAGALVMDTGFIQANTADASGRARGGNVTIEVESLVPSANMLFAGGTEPLEFQPGRFGFNVIQAAAPTGLGGNVTITSPALDLSGTIAGPNAALLDSGLARNPCDSTGGSSIGQAGRGGMPVSARGFLRAAADEEAGSARLAQASWSSTCRKYSSRRR